MVLQVSGQNGFLYITDDESVGSRLDMCDYVMPGRIQNHDTVIEVMLLHGAHSAVELRESRMGFGLEEIVGAAVVEIVRQTAHDQSQLLYILQVFGDLGRVLEYGEHTLSHVERVAPVVVLDVSVVFAHSQQPLVIKNNVIIK